MKTQFILHTLTIVLALILITSIISFILCFTFHGKMKETGTTHWWSPNTEPNTGATNESGFTSLPCGFRGEGGFGGIGYLGFWWSSTEFDAADAWRQYLNEHRYSTHLQAHRLVTHLRYYHQDSKFLHC